MFCLHVKLLLLLLLLRNCIKNTLLRWDRMKDGSEGKNEEEEVTATG